MLKRNYGADGNLEITLDNLDDIGRVFADITDIYFGIKVLESDADDSLFYKTLNTDPGPGGITTVPQYNKVIVEWKADEYTNMVIGESYFICFAVLFTGETVYTEISTNQSKVEITQDRVRR